MANTRIIIGEGGTVAIQGDTMLFLNFGDAARAEEFLARRLARFGPPQNTRSFEVPRSFLDDLRSSAVTEAQLAENPALAGSPLVVDINQALDQFSLRADQIEQLRRAIIQGSGRNER